jgi:hypothetical protein
MFKYVEFQDMDDKSLQKEEDKSHHTTKHHSFTRIQAFN